MSHLIRPPVSALFGRLPFPKTKTAFGSLPKAVFFHSANTASLGPRIAEAESAGRNYRDEIREQNTGTKSRDKIRKQNTGAKNGREMQGQNPEAKRRSNKRAGNAGE